MTDRELIDYHGGPARLCDLLGYSKANGGVQRVHNWRARGIPLRVKVQFPELFGSALNTVEAANTEAQTEPQVASL